MKSLRDEWSFLLSPHGGKYYIVAFIVPIIVVLLFSAIFANNQVNEGKVVVIDLDHSPYSQELINKLNNSQYISVEGVLNQPTDPEKLFYHDEFIGVIYLPQGLAENYHKGMPNQLGLLLDNTNLASSGNLRTAVQEIVTSENMTVSIPRVKSLGVSDDQVTGILSNMTVQQRLLFNPNGSYVNTMVMGFMNLYTAIFFCFATLPILPRFRVQRRFDSVILNSSPLGVASRVIPYAVLSAIGLYFGFGLLKIVGGFRFAGNPIAFLLPTFIYTLSMGLMAMFASWKAKHPGEAMGKMMFIVVPGFLFSGITVSQALLPKWALIISNVFPMVWYTKFIRSMGLRGASLSDLLGELGGFLLLLGVVLFCVILRYHLEKSAILKRNEGAKEATPQMEMPQLQQG